MIGDAFGWRAVFFVLAGLFAAAALGLARELKVNPLTREPERAAATLASVMADYRRILGSSWVRIMLLAVFLAELAGFEDDERIRIVAAAAASGSMSCTPRSSTP